VSISSSARRAAFWHADWFVALVIVLAVWSLHQGTDAIASLERRFYDFGSTSSAPQPSERIAVIAIDDQSVANIGRTSIQAAAGRPRAPGYDAARNASNGGYAPLASGAAVGTPPSAGVQPDGDRPSDLEP
jgi:hypothetical protein